MLGPHLLVAPVYTDSVVRDGIFLPSDPFTPGAKAPAPSGPTPWFDWWTGTAMAGNTTYDNVSAPLDTLPLYVKGGAIIPLWPVGINYFNEVAHDPLSVELWPHGHSVFTLYVAMVFCCCCCLVLVLRSVCPRRVPFVFPP